MNKSAQPDEDADWSQATPGVDYLCFDLYMRIQNPRKFTLLKIPFSLLGKT
ncbi:hypothetical protein [uncultured Ruminococcus sp.]|uniref:hypothetical protein n=1 Tax=uncultured Ruminococcus sp. TaxID=165186 RepID=UPI0025F40B14|nr:hypothetical protein [uncultured Ruminococcus sp.]